MTETRPDAAQRLLAALDRLTVREQDRAARRYVTDHEIDHADVEAAAAREHGWPTSGLEELGY